MMEGDIFMKFSKELEERIDKAIEEWEKEEREGTLKFYSEEEVIKDILGNKYRDEIHNPLFYKSKNKVKNYL